MHEPTRRELFLQNRLALSSTLLFSCSQVLQGRSSEDRRALIIECEHFFSETARLLAAELQAETAKAESPTSAPPAGKSGAALNWAHPNGPPQPCLVPSPAESDGDIISPVPSLEFSPGGTPETESPSPTSLITRIRLSYTMKLNAISTGS